MKRAAKTVSAALALVVIAWWLIAGAHRGWTKTSVPVKTLDEITGIEAITYEKRFVPGVDFLGAGLVAAGALFGISLLFRNSKTQI